MHKFIWVFSDFLVESIEEVKDVKKKLDSAEIKDISIIDTAIDYASSKK